MLETDVPGHRFGMRPLPSSIFSCFFHASGNIHMHSFGQYVCRFWLEEIDWFKGIYAFKQVNSFVALKDVNQSVSP
jgi:hypothetical protein